ncbi:MAG: 2-isopropylmalate synthase [Candidatus Omnitrophota bacterium]|nr:2-isopropylmalate synthase [Candidatus Omnitrophota bacterium]MBU1928842.1 2-isopropylmalate synthase [Candidatus Omnitrophota bacterium]MBU2034452.1 2-isopropylmalate synthase [Candidatus Omnitrophota bacterium]MBU2221115.1 2-isopropylmalate synthase [Candidatus Omnitrophota bacterium]
MDKIIIFDTTLRDGEQAPGASLNQKEKIEVARSLAELRVDVIEAGFPISSKGDFESVKDIARNIKGPVICGLSRSIKKDIDAAYEALKPAKNPRIHVFLATSKIHMKYKLKKAEDEILRLAVEAVTYAKKLCPDIEFSPEDASRTEKEFLHRVVEAVINAGAGTVNIPDTVGYSEPEEFGRIIKGIKENVVNIHKAVISVHCHNDLGLAVANSLAAVKNGARQVECTINGIGERAGNASLEEIVMSIDTRKDIYAGLKTGIIKKNIYKTSRLVSKLTGFVIAPNKAIVGGNAFRHESGIHQDGVLKERSTYEIIRGEDVGFQVEGLVLGKHSGRHAFSERLKKIGFHLNEEQLNKAFENFKNLADKKKDIFDDDLRTIIEDEITIARIPVWELVNFRASSGTEIKPEALVQLRKKGNILKGSSFGDGPVDASFKAIDKIVNIKGSLEDFRLGAVTSGKDALGEVILKLKIKDKVASGRGTSTDIVEAAIKAYLDALNKVHSK